MLSGSCRADRLTCEPLEYDSYAQAETVLAAQQLDACAEDLRQHVHDGQAQPAAGTALIAVQSIEAREDFVALVFRNAGAVILDFDDHLFVLAQDANDHVAIVTVV